MPVKQGDTVSVHYTGTLIDGTVFDSSVDRDPLVVKVGSGQVIQGFDEALAGMEIGEKREAIITPEKGYGPSQLQLIREFPKSMLGEQELTVGMVVHLSDDKGNALQASVESITEENVVFNFNHPLAGKTLRFLIELVEIESAE